MSIPAQAEGYTYQKYRERRFAFFRSLLNTVKAEKPISILDIGGEEVYWERMNFTDPREINVTLLNIFVEPVKHSNFTSIKGDACDLSNFKDREFDVVFSNSVIEHLFTIENQKRMANEVRRVGKNYYVQTPNYYFPIEPHWIFPFFQFMPFPVKVFLTNNFDLGVFKKTKNIEAAKRLVREVNLLTEKEMKNLFPEGKVYREPFFGLTKSVTLYKFE